MIMSWKDKLKAKKEKLMERYQSNLSYYEQKHAEKLRHKHQRIVDMKPGAVKAIREGLAMHKKPLQVMKDEYERRKTEREQKKND
jgi:DNA-binding transcriptional regulator YiaG